MTIGIDKIGFATSQYVLRLSELAAARNTDPEKLSKGLLLKELSIAPITEDIVTLGASASHSILTEEEKDEIDMVILATESGIDQSKVDKSTEKWLDGIEDRLEYQKWYCGHFHTEKKIDRLEIMFENFDVFCSRK